MHSVCVCVCEMNVNACVCGLTWLYFHTLVDSPAGRAFHQGGGGGEEKKRAPGVCIPFHFLPPKKKKEVPPVIPAIWLISCHTCLVFFQGKTGQKTRGKGAVRREGGSPGRLQLRGGSFVGNIWTHQEKTAFLTAWQNKWKHARKDGQFGWMQAVGCSVIYNNRGLLST